MRRLFCLGYGYSAARFVTLHGSKFAGIAATWRRPEQRDLLASTGIQPVGVDDSAALTDAARSADVLLVSAGPGAGSDPFVARVGEALETATTAPIVLYLSTVGIYGDQGGGWVTEETRPMPSSDRSLRRLAAEQAWLALGARTGARVHLLRLAGIYGPGSSQIDNLRAGKARRIVKPGQVFNRIHVDDIAAVCAALLEYRGGRRIWNVADDEPCPPQEAVRHAAELLGLPPPPEEPFETAELSPMSRSFYAENKRVSNRAIREDLGVRLRYPTYREGLAALV